MLTQVFVVEFYYNELRAPKPPYKSVDHEHRMYMHKQMCAHFFCLKLKNWRHTCRRILCRQCYKNFRLKIKQHINYSCFYYSFWYIVLLEKQCNFIKRQIPRRKRIFLPIRQQFSSAHELMERLLR